MVLAAWDDQADVEDLEEDLTLDQAWDGPVDQVAAVCQSGFRIFQSVCTEMEISPGHGWI